MFWKKKKDNIKDEPHLEEVGDDEALNVSNNEQLALEDDYLSATSENTSEEKPGLRQKYLQISRMFKKHLIYVRITVLTAVTVVLGISLAGGMIFGLHTQGAKAREITPPGTKVQFSKTGGSLTVGQVLRSGSTMMIPLYTNDAAMLDMTKKASGQGGSFNGVTTGITLPSYDTNTNSNDSSFIPISAKGYRMFISPLKGKLNPAMQAKYVKFGATGIGGIVLSNVNPDTTVRVLLENKKVYTIPGASAPGLTVDGKPVQTNRDVTLINTNMMSSKPSDRKFTIKSSEKTLLNVAYADDYMKLWKKDKSVLEDIMTVDQHKLDELKANKGSLNAGDANSGGQNGGQQNSRDDIIGAQQNIVDTDKSTLNQLDNQRTALEQYVDKVSDQMSMSTDFKAVRK